MKNKEYKIEIIVKEEPFKILDQYNLYLEEAGSIRFNLHIDEAGIVTYDSTFLNNTSSTAISFEPLNELKYLKGESPCKTRLEEGRRKMKKE
jgi:hypothetical protein